MLEIADQQQSMVPTWSFGGPSLGLTATRLETTVVHRAPRASTMRQAHRRLCWTSWKRKGTYCIPCGHAGVEARTCYNGGRREQDAASLHCFCSMYRHLIGTMRAALHARGMKATELGLQEPLGPGESPAVVLLCGSVQHKK